MWKRTVLPILLGVLSVSATFGVSYFKGDFSQLPRWGKICMCVGLFLAFLPPCLAASNARETQKEKLKNDAYAALLAALALIADKVAVPVRDIGLSAYVVRRHSFWKKNPQYQARVARVRLSNYPRPSTIRWVRGKGFLGECWAKENFVIDRHITSSYRDYVGCDAAKWDGAPDHLKLGLSFEEWESTQARYTYVSVAPVFTNNDGATQYLGCISLDTGVEEHTEKLKKIEVRELLCDAAKTLEVALSKKT